MGPRLVNVSITATYEPWSLLSTLSCKKLKKTTLFINQEGKILNIACMNLFNYEWNEFVLNRQDCLFKSTKNKPLIKGINKWDKWDDSVCPIPSHFGILLNKKLYRHNMFMVHMQRRKKQGKYAHKRNLKIKHTNHGLTIIEDVELSLTFTSWESPSLEPTKTTPLSK